MPNSRYNYTISTTSPIRGIHALTANASWGSASARREPESRRNPAADALASGDLGPRSHPTNLHSSEQDEALTALLEVVAIRLEQWEFAHCSHLESCRQSVVDLAVAIAEHIVRQRVTAGEYNLPEVVAQLWDRLGSNAGQLVFHPDDLQLLERRFSTWWHEHVIDRKIRFTSDPTAERGSCRLETADQQWIVGTEFDLQAIAELLEATQANRFAHVPAVARGESST